MNILVTGGTGVLGFHLLNTLQGAEGKLYSFSDRPPSPHHLVPKVHYCYGNLLNTEELRNFIADVKPDEVYHIATQSSVRESQKKPVETLNTNILGTHNLLDSLRLVAPKCRVLLLSAGEVYGRGEGLLDVMHLEEDALSPLSPLATSKACMEMVAQQFVNAWNMSIMIARPFAYTGPLQSRQYTIAHVASQLVEIMLHNSEPVIYTGNLDISRDIIDIRDLTRAFTVIMRMGEPGEAYNICSGQVRTLREVTETLILMCGLDVDIRFDFTLERQIEIPMLIGSPEKLRQNTGWNPLISIEDSLDDLFEEMKIRVQRSAK